MSRLSDLLNPAPSPQSTPPRPIDVTAAEAGHGRNASITSPLEALAIAATEGPSGTSLPQPTSGPLPPVSRLESHPTSQSKPTQAPLYVDAGPPARQVKQEQGTPSRMSEVMSAQEEVEQTSDALTSLAQQEMEGDMSTKHRSSQELSEAKSAGEKKAPVPSIITEVKKEPETNPPTPAEQSPLVLPSTEGKKRPAPKSAKKGTASLIKKPASKKRKVETPSKDGTPMSQRSGTPNSSRASKTPAPKNRKRNSATPARSSPPRSVEGDDDDMDDDGELFCICRKPDDHKWMIGCDGGCDDWFHGRCVDMKEEDAELIDKYICPNCTKKSVGVTTWKPMCRLEGCRDPARVAPPNPSKYCCDEHGEEFMRQKIFGKGSSSELTAAKKKRPSEKTETWLKQTDGAADAADAEDHQAHLRGGYLKPAELKSLSSSSKDVSDFRRLGESVLAADSVNSTIDEKMTGAIEQEELLSTPEERSRLEEIKSKQAGLKHRLDALKDKDKLLLMVRARAAQVVTELNKRPSEGKKKDTVKDICGFDSRLSWSDVEFDEWRQSSEGIKVLESSVLGPPAARNIAVDGDGDTNMDRDVDIGRGVCQKKRCERHKAWYKLHQQEIASERSECNQLLRRLDHEATGINERAMLKKLEVEAEVLAEQPNP